ncbi:MAG: hypothetical protein JWN57_635, partial [Frankiales bacterium]|nr:hypothetical protein [Frankiales bacterium]
PPAPLLAARPAADARTGRAATGEPVVDAYR